MSFVLLTDPEWEPEEPGDEPPFAAVVGMWPLAEDGAAGEFRPNPEYRPRYGSGPADPLDALLQLTLRGDAEPDQLQAVLRGSLVELALNGDGRPLVLRADDGVLCAMIATSPGRFLAPDWRRVTAGELAGILGTDTDVLVNPGGPGALRLSAEFLRETVSA
ncbi:type VII secretion system-associated protein [Actinoplanes sp. RD1]|uniref:type VII secretion system-associated protein n=1 Tax=Actinoplanes sp. RD1 TaxID=3064538 RepID=UPI002740A2C7|nr:type VII secretion system-associated protein [Actinoplanes sp. RD1]